MYECFHGVYRQTWESRRDPSRRCGRGILGWCGVGKADTGAKETCGGPGPRTLHSWPASRAPALLRHPHTRLLPRYKKGKKKEVIRPRASQRKENTNTR